jgi:sugar lactone lactonase YvrE
VLRFIGTFVSMKGADALPALIRKTEAKPLRIFLQDGKNDHIVAAQPYGTFFAGSWPINNEVMHEALESVGYDVKLEIGEGGHDTRQGSAIMPGALRWLWRGYPDPIVPHPPAAMTQPGWDPRGKASSVVSMDKPWEQVGETYGAITSPTTDKDGNVYFADPSANRIYKSDPNRAVILFKDNTSGARSLTMGPDGRIYATQPVRKRIVSYGPGGDEKVVADNVEAAGLAVTAKSGVYFADSTHKIIGFVAPGAKSRTVYDGGQLAIPANVALSPDQAMLIVADAQSRFSWSFQIAADGSLINGEPFYRLELPETGWMSGASAASEDTNGQVYFATAIGIQVCEANGRLAAILNPPEYGTVTSFAFAGKDFGWLYATEGGKLYRRPVKVHGAPSWTLAKLPRPPL